MRLIVRQIQRAASQGRFLGLDRCRRRRFLVAPSPEAPWHRSAASSALSRRRRGMQAKAKIRILWDIDNGARKVATTLAEASSSRRRSGQDPLMLDNGRIARFNPAAMRSMCVQRPCHVSRVMTSVSLMYQKIASWSSNILGATRSPKVHSAPSAWANLRLCI